LRRRRYVHISVHFVISPQLFGGQGAARNLGFNNL